MLEFLLKAPRNLAKLMVRFYQLFISPALPPSCIHHPTCSQYAILALEKHGVLKGSYYAVRRILSCRPNAKSKYNDYP